MELRSRLHRWFADSLKYRIATYLVVAILIASLLLGALFFGTHLILIQHRLYSLEGLLASYGVTTLALIIFALLLARHLAKTLTAPLTVIDQMALRIARKGPSAAQIRIERHDEIGQLATSFNAMVEALRHTQEDLKNQVAERSQALELGEANLRRAQSISHTGSWHRDMVNDVLTWSEEAYRLFGLEMDQPLNIEEFIARIHPEDREMVLFAWIASPHGKPYEIEHRIMVGDNIKWVHQRAEWVLDAKGLPVSSVGTMQDITDRRRAEEQSRLAASVFSETSEGILITDVDGFILEANRAFCRLTGYERDEIIGQHTRLLKSGHQDPSFYQQLWSTLLQTGHWRGEIRNRRKSGELYVAHLAINAVPDASGRTTHYVSLSSDITDVKHYEETLERLAYHDALTQLPNRLLLLDRLHQALAIARRQHMSVAICYLDLDGFKPINDRYGHKAGDELLIEIARRMQAMIRPQDTVSRLGGDEFVILLTELESVDICESILHRLTREITAPISFAPEQVVQVSASIGVTLYPSDNATSEMLLRHADQAMYQAKAAGRNQVHWFDPAQIGESSEPLLNAP